MNDYATDKRTKWIQEIQDEMTWVELLEAKDFLLILILLNEIIAILILGTGTK
jgi:hypothetical protein